MELAHVWIAVLTPLLKEKATLNALLAPSEILLMDRRSREGVGPVAPVITVMPLVAITAPRVNILRAALDRALTVQQAHTPSTLVLAPAPPHAAPVQSVPTLQRELAPPLFARPVRLART